MVSIHDVDKKTGEIREWLRADVNLLTETTGIVAKVNQRPPDFITKVDRDAGITRTRDIDEKQREIHLIIDRIVTEMDIILALMPRVEGNIARGYVEVDIEERNDDEDNDNDDEDNDNDYEDNDGDDE